MEMDLHTIRNLMLGKSDINEAEQLDEISNYNQVVTYYRYLGLDPYKLRGVTGAKLREKIKESPAFKAWLQLRLHRESVDFNRSLLETIKDAKKDSIGKKAKVTFYGYPDKKSRMSDSEKEIANTPNNFLNQN